MDEEDAFPAALPDDPAGTGSALGWTAAVVAITTLLLAVFNAQALEGWADDLTPSPAVGHVVAAASAWRARTDRYALGVPRRRLHAAWKAAERAGHPADSAADQR